jgi:outer membrane receptor protein involved in Fe transport
MSGVVNIITKHPQNMRGTTLTIGTPNASIVHAQGDESFAYKLTAGYFEDDAYDRPTGIIPGSDPQSSYPAYANDGTQQKHFNSRFDFGLSGDSSLTLGAGLARTDGIIHSGIGPFDIDSDTELSYLQADYRAGTLQIGISAQMLDGNATNLLTRDASGQPLGFRFVNDTYNVELTNTSVIGAHHLVTYGGNLRTHDFELTIAPQARSKDEWGLFIQDDIRLTDNLRWVVGVRYDDIDPLRDTVLTPRTSLIYTLSPAHTVRISYNEAFRTPSTVNSYLDVSILQPLPGGIAISGDAVGNIRLTEESLKAWEVGYVAEFDGVMSMSVSIYRNETTGSIDFYESDHYDAANPPTPFPNWPAGLINCFFIPPGTSMLCPEGGLAGVVPSDYGYRNIGQSIDRGIEFEFEWDMSEFSELPGYLWGNVSWQDEPDLVGADNDEVNRAPEWRANVGIGVDEGEFFWNASVNYQSKAYWADVLFARAYTEGFAQFNASLGWRFRNESMTFKLIGQNLTDKRLQQHIFGDHLERRIDAQVSFTF